MARLLADEGTGIVDSAMLRRHTENFIILCATEYRYSISLLGKLYILYASSIPLLTIHIYVCDRFRLFIT
jgi:hypothetical protein